MNKKLLQVAVATALGTVAGTAMAFNPTATPPDYTVYMAGSTAATTTVREFITQSVCDTTQAIDVYRRSAASGFGNDWAVACKVNSATTGASAKNVLFIKRDAGGSGWGVTPVTNATVAPVMSVVVGSGQNCDDTANPPTTQTTSGGTSYTQHICGAANANLIPDAGFSDVEPDKFAGINAAAGLPDFNAATALPFVSKPIAALVFGVPVSLNLRTALQTVQFDKATSHCNPLYDNNGSDPTHSEYNANKETQACMPNLSSTEIRTMYTGGFGKWDSFMVKNPANPNGALIKLASHPDVVAQALAPADTKIEICRRTPGSGTQATAGIVFLNSPCDPNAYAMLSEPGNTFAGPVVANNSGSGDVERCLDDFNNGTNNSGKNATLTKRWAIGLQSTEFNAGLGFNYRFVKIDGYAPTIESVAAGHYYDYSEPTMQWRTDITTLYNASATADKNDTLTILNYIASSATTPTVLANLNAAYVHSFGHGGWLAIPGSSFSPSNPFTASNPVNSSTRAPFGRSPNTCQPPVSVKANAVQVDSSF